MTTSFLDMLFGWFSREPAPAPPGPEEIFLEAQRSRGRVELEQMVRGKTPMMNTVIELVRPDALIIARPSADGRMRPLVRNERLRIIFHLSGRRLAGTTRCLKRVRLEAGADGGVLYGYALERPSRLVDAERRSHERIAVGARLVCEGELHVFDLAAPVRGVVLDLSPKGVQLRARHEDVPMKRGQKAYLKLSLPAPIGLVTERVTIVRVTPCPSTGRALVAVSFERPVELLRPVHRLAKYTAA